MSLKLCTYLCSIFSWKSLAMFLHWYWLLAIIRTLGIGFEFELVISSSLFPISTLSKSRPYVHKRLLFAFDNPYLSHSNLGHTGCMSYKKLFVYEFSNLFTIIWKIKISPWGNFRKHFYDFSFDFQFFPNPGVPFLKRFKIFK